MNTKSLYAIGFTLAIGILVAGVLYLFGQQGSLNPSPSPTSVAEQNTQEASSFAQAVSYKCEAGKSPFDLLKSNSSDIKSSESDFGVFVTSINGIEQGNGKYWLYLVNGQDATVSASKYVCQDQEDIKWELR